MMMEVKVDVHVVHPTADGPIPGQTNTEKKTHGSWCSPERGAPQTSLKRTKSNYETKTIPPDKADVNNRIDIQRVRLFSESPILKPIFKSCEDIKEEPIKLKEEHQVKQRRFHNTIQPEKEKSLIPESPQSPVPTSPSKPKKHRGHITLPTFCDPFIPIDPQGRVYISWLLLVTFCYSYNAWCIFLRATFPYQTPENMATWMVADYFCDLVYLLDVSLVKPRLMYLHEGFWIDDLKETRRNYRKKLQYKFDVISLLPLDIFYIILGPNEVILRIPRILKLQTFWEFHQSMDRVLKSPYVVRIGKTLFYIFYLIHLNACAYYAMSVYEGLATNGWVYDNEGNAYLRCFYFATKTATSIGKNPKPENLKEYLFMTAAWLMGVFVFALLIGQIRDIIATATKAKTEYRKSIDSCTYYMRKWNLPATLQRRVMAWFRYTWNQQRCFDESRILNSLPYNMKLDVALAVHMTTLSKVQLFRDCSTSLLRDLVLQMRPVSFVPGDVVVRKGDVGHDMYIIKLGECVVMSPDESEVVATLHEGSVFGEISLLGLEGLRRRTATVISRGYSSLFALSRNDLNAALKYHKEAALVLRLRADQVIKENAARQEQQRLAAMQKSTNQMDQNLDNVLRRRKVSSDTKYDSDDDQKSSASGLSRKKMSVPSESSPVVCNETLAAACNVGKSKPTIVLSDD